MNKVLNFLTHAKRLRIRFLILFLLLIYIPITLNTIFVYTQALQVVKEEKMQAMEQILKKTVESTQLNMEGIKKSIFNISSNRALRKTVQGFESYTPTQQERLTGFYNQEFEKLEQNSFIDRVFCITINGKLYFDDESHIIDSRAFMKSALQKEFLQSMEDETWQYGFFDFYSAEADGEPMLFMLHKLKEVGVATKGEHKKTIDMEETIGYLFVMLDIGSFQSLFENIPYELAGQISFYDKDFTPILTSPKYNVPAGILRSHAQADLIGKADEIKIKGTAYALGVAALDYPKWYIINIISVEELMHLIRSALRNSYWLIIPVSIIVALWVFIEMVILSRLVTEKEMTNYRLLVSEDTLQKLRIYKHDFMNHLQIIHSLIEMNQSQKAAQYLKKISEEGKIITQNYEIGIPEIESAIFTSIISAEKNNIEVKIDTIKLPANINVNIYDLVKIITNLIKNAMYALTRADAEDKLLTIRIYSELDEYVFKISNNVPIIREDLRQVIFDKGFTTKGKEGSGLGLHIVKKLVRENHGRIDLVVDERGNHFIVRFPQYRM
ncbi:ATP-binding protein [Petroclostridium sp. X23]|uniref:ATP-binding protein n=1 Tax=Petroclostridium sp. X23 TaxID=3045146 RepID=UPI0024AD7F25|nr:ATP-binding protein [Petroclostridium sp. X23]WHH61189.1 Spo0B domain-containing protein [Petroclostridium sp. X23]